MTKPKREVPMKEAMQAAGFNKKNAAAIESGWAKLGITGVRVGGTRLTVSKPKPKKGTST